jgi:hypothetical protein
VPSGETSCLNCGAPLAGEFCASCGQKRPHTDLSLREFLRETTEELTHWEGKVPRTLKTLLTRPGLLTIDFLAGRRARWLAPLRVYLICSVAFFVMKPIVESLGGQTGPENVRVTYSGPGGTMTAEDSADVEQGLTARFLGKERVLRAAENPKALQDTFNAGLPKAMFVLLPFFALLTKLMWRARMPTYPAHLYVSLHIHAAFFAILTVSTVNQGFLPNKVAFVIGVLIFGYMIWYPLAAFRRIFAESWAMTLAKSAVVGVTYLGAVFATSLALLGWAVVRA